MPSVLAVWWLLGAAGAAELRSGEGVVVADGEVVHDDLYVAGGEVEVRGLVDGDLVVAGGRVEVTGHVNGDLIAVGGEVNLTGSVVGSVRAAGGDVRLAGQVAEDAVLAGGSVEVARDSRVARDLVVTGGDVTVAGTVARSLRAAAGNLGLASTVGGDVYARGERVSLAESARVGGELRVESAEEPEISDAAVVAGGVRYTPVEGRRGWAAAVLGWTRAWVGLFLAGLVVVFGFPGFARRAERALQGRPAASFAVGLLALVGVPLVAALIALIGALLGGWWIAPITLFLLGVLALVGLVVSGLWVGDSVARRVSARHLHPAAALGAGLLVLLLLGAVPYLGGLVVLGAVLFGLGAVALAGVDAPREAVV